MSAMHPPAHHRQPQGHHPDRPRRPRPHPIRAQIHPVKLVEITSLSLSRVTGSLNSLATWNAAPSKESVTGAFRMHALSMAWDFAESNPFLDGQPTEISTSAAWVARALENLPLGPGTANQSDASTRGYDTEVIATDPPYYDNVPYSDISDFFYVWLRQTTGKI